MRKSIFILTLLFALPLLAQDSTQIQRPFDVTVAARVEPTRVPLNRPLTLYVTVSWSGDLDRVTLGEFDNPELSNFTVTGSSSSHRIEAGAQGRRSVKAYTYTLEPKNLGMAYIEPVSLSYTDTAEDQVRRVATPRFSVEVTSPVAEPGETPIPWPVLGLLAVVMALAVWIVRRNRRSDAAEDVAPEVPVEEAYLARLKAEVDRRAGGRDAFFALSKLVRGYLSDREGLPARETPTDALVELLKTTELDVTVQEKLGRLLSTADRIKFSGQAADPSTLDDAYTTLENLLERRLAADLAQASEAVSQPSKGFLKRRSQG